MGNEIGKQNSRLGVCAIAFTTTNIEKNELFDLNTKIAELKAATNNSNASNDNIYTVTKVQFDDCLKHISKFDSSDTELFTSLFTMFDNTGEGTINIREYLSGVGSCLITGSTVDKLQFAFAIYDNTTTEYTRGDVKKILNSIVNVASYFGDPVVSAENIDGIVLDVYKNVAGQSMPVADIINEVVAHPTTILFTEGKGSIRFGR